MKKVYFAGVSDIKRTKILLDNGFKHFMCTFASPPSQNVLNLLRSYDGVEIMLDSGAFTAWNKGKTIDINKYMKFLKDNKIEIYFNLDVIGDVEGTKRNQTIMEAHGFSPIPVFHYGEPMEYLHWLVEKGYKYIGIGGTVGLSVQKRKSFFTDIFYLYPNVDFHGLGVTARPLLEGFNWYSTDSTSWLTPFKNKVYLTNEGVSVKAPDMDPVDRFMKSLEYFKYINNLERL